MVMKVPFVIDIGSNDATSLKVYTGKFKKWELIPRKSSDKCKYHTDSRFLKLFKEFSTEKQNRHLCHVYDLEDPIAL